MKTPAAVTVERRDKAHKMAVHLEYEYTIDHARKIIKDHLADPETTDEGRKFWANVRNIYEARINPTLHKPRTVCVACDQYNLSGRLAKEGLK